MMSDNPSENISINLDTVTSIVGSLQRVVADYYGPQCTQTLLTSRTGKAVVTSDGMCILDALQPSHPVAQMVFKAIKSCHTVTLDGTKSFLLYLAYIFLHLQEEVSLGRFCHNRTTLSSALERSGVIGAREYVHQLKLVVLELCEKMQMHGDKLAETLHQKMDEKDIMRSVVKTAMMPHYNSKLCDHYVSQLISSLPVSSDRFSFIQVLQYLVDNFYKLTIKVPDQPYSGSTVANLFLLNRQFSLKCDNLLSLGVMSALILKGTIDVSNSDEESQQTFVWQQAGNVTCLLQHRRKNVEIFVHNLAMKKIDLLICTEGIPDYALNILRSCNLSVISNVNNEDVELIECFTQKLVLTDMHDCIEERNIIPLSGVQELVVGGKVYVQLNLKNVRYPLKHLVVCAPTVGLCDQLAVAFHKALNALKMCFVQEDSETILVKKNSRNLGRLNTLNNSEDKHITVKMDTSFQGSDKVEVDQLLESKNLTREDLSVQENDMQKAEDCSSTYEKTCQNSRIHVQSQNVKISVIEGGGSFEILLAKLLQDFSNSCSNPNLSVISRVLEKSMISVVKKLFENSSLLPGDRRKFLEVMTDLDRKYISGQLWGLNRRGAPCNLSRTGVIEPLTSKIHILQCVLNLVDQLLSIDEIVSVRKLES